MKTVFMLCILFLHTFIAQSQTLVQHQLAPCAYTGDINGDGIDDIITLNDKVLTVSRADAGLSTLLTYTFPFAVKRIIVGDFVNSGRERGKKQIAALLTDGNTQVFAISDDLKSLWWWFTQSSFIADNELFAVANFDNDIAQEIMVHNPVSGQIRFYKRGANGFFSVLSNFELGNLAGTSLVNVRLFVGAFSSDHPNRKDLLVYDPVARQLKLYGSVILPNGNLTFWWAFNTNSNLFPADAQICVANIDGGTKDGLVVRNGNNTYSLFKVEHGNGKLVVESGALTGQLPAGSGACQLVAAKVRDAAFRNERGGKTRDDILLVQLANNQLIRTDARFDGKNLTYWWAFNSGLPGKCAPLQVSANKTAFDPGRHGFKFANNFSIQPVFDVRFSGFCGGMTYAALDYYFNNRPIPNQDWKPANKTPLFEYLWARQVQSNSNNADKWTELTTNPFGWRDEEFFNWGLQAFNGGRIEELKSEIDNGRPVPIGLHQGGKGAAGSHWVIATGYDMGRYEGKLGNYKEDFKIFVCDPNYPNETLTLVPNPGRLNYYYKERPDRSWMTYFVDKKYRTANPPNIAPINFPNDGLVRMLLLDIETGGDDLRGGNDNAYGYVYLRDGAFYEFPLNNGAGWGNGSRNTATFTLPHGKTQRDVAVFGIRTTFGGGVGGDNWNLDRVEIQYSGGTSGTGTLLARSGTPLMRFTGDNRDWRVNL